MTTADRKFQSASLNPLQPDYPTHVMWFRSISVGVFIGVNVAAVIGLWIMRGVS